MKGCMHERERKREKEGEREKLTRVRERKRLNALNDKIRTFAFSLLVNYILL